MTFPANPLGLTQDKVCPALVLHIVHDGVVDASEAGKGLCWHAAQYSVPGAVVFPVS